MGFSRDIAGGADRESRLHDPFFANAAAFEPGFDISPLSVPRHHVTLRPGHDSGGSSGLRGRASK